MSKQATIVLFRVALANALISVYLSAYLISLAQSGPSWEVPVAVMEALRTLPQVALLLAVVAVVLYVWRVDRGAVAVRARRAFWAVAVLALLLPVLIWLTRPEQWAFQFVTLSALASMLVVPVVILAVLAFWLIGVRWMRG